MNTVLQLAHIVAGFVVLAEALNKLERSAPFAPGLDARKRLVDGLKAAAWLLLALGAGGALVDPFLGPLTAHTQGAEAQLRKLADASVLIGFAVLVVRTRVKEG